MSVKINSFVLKLYGLICVIVCFPITVGLPDNKFENRTFSYLYSLPIFNEGWSLAFSRTERNNNGIYIISSDGKLIDISDPSEKMSSISKLSWSPDGKQIAYMRGTAGLNHNEIKISNTNGTRIVKLSNGSDPSWSPDGKDILFIRNDDIYVLNLGTQKVAPLLISKDLMESTPEWSPNGQYIAYVGKENNRDGKLYVMKTDGTNSQLVKMEESVDIYSGINWSPDSKKIAFISRKPCGDVYVIDLITNQATNLTKTIGDEVSPSWSPDGHSIVFSGMQPSNKCPEPDDPLIGISYKIFSINDDGSGYHEISIPFNNAWIKSPKWSPAIGLQQSHTFSITLLGDNLHLREAPSTNSKILDTLRIGTMVTPQNGPQMNNGYRWWKVKIVSNGIEGWVVDEPGYFRPVYDDLNIQ